MARSASQPLPDGRQERLARMTGSLIQRSAAHEMPSAFPEATASGKATLFCADPRRADKSAMTR